MSKDILLPEIRAKIEKMIKDIYEEPPEPPPTPPRKAQALREPAILREETWHKRRRSRG